MTTQESDTERSAGSSQDPPRYCPTYNHDLTDTPYYQIGPGRAAKILRKIAIALLPIMAVLYLAQLMWGHTPMGFGTGAGFFAVAFIGGPSLFLYVISRLFPKVRLVICPRCSWNQEYPLKRQTPKHAPARS